MKLDNETNDMLTNLSLRGMKDNLNKVINLAEKKNLSYLNFLNQLLKSEIDDRILFLLQIYHLKIGLKCWEILS